MNITFIRLFKQFIKPLRGITHQIIIRLNLLYFLINNLKWYTYLILHLQKVIVFRELLQFVRNDLITTYTSLLSIITLPIIFT